MKSKFCELLSPAGSPETLESAIKGGCDAVYFGGKSFNARMNAKNFSNEDVLRSVDKCHSKDVRAYVTFNTLILDRELENALEYAYFLYKAGVDALIITDLGLSAEIKKYMPDFELHASTQLSGHNADAARFLRERGFSRMVTSRETSKKDLEKLINDSEIEIEAFVHGAMCVCQSGQCLMSSFIGGRSGNRGECAQPCRLPYNGSYPLSLKDMCLAKHITELAGTGVASLKIEGRMKSPEYVYSVTSTYRRLLDENRNASDREIAFMADVFSRQGFSDGYYTGKINGSMLGVRSEEQKKTSSGPYIKQTDLKYVRRKIALPERNALRPSYVYKKKKSENGKTVFSARFYDPSSVPATDFFDIVYLPLDKFDPCKANGFFLPPVVFDLEKENCLRLIKTAVEKGAKHALICNIGQFGLLKDFDIEKHADYRLNVYNSPFADVIGSAEKFSSVMLSPELTLPQIRDISCEKAVIVYGRVPLMTLEKRVGTNRLTDRRKAAFPVISEGKRDIVFNSVPVYMADRRTDLDKAGITERHFVFSVEKKDEVLRVVEAYKKGTPPVFPVKRIK